MKRVLIIIALITFIITGCEEDGNNPITVMSDEYRIPFEINFTDYSDNNYFIDEVYADTTSGLNMFYKYYGNLTPIVVPEYIINELEVFISATASDDIVKCIKAEAFIHLPPRTSSQLYSDSLRNFPYAIPGQVETGYFFRLSEGMDYHFSRETGYITFNFTPPTNRIIAVAYKIKAKNSSSNADLIYGEFMAELVNSGTTSAVLKLVKPNNLTPAMTDAWKLKLRNIYNMDPYGGWGNKVKMDIFLRLKNGDEINKIGDLSFLQLFGFDKFDETRNNNPDGIFDDRAGINYIPYTSEIIFPVLQPFGRNLSGLLGDSLKYQAIYDSTKNLLSEPDNSFIIRGSFVLR